MTERSYLSIGDVLALLREEFPDITISKIRFLESRGLLIPERTPSGYRKFYDHDVERLRWILRQQREHFLPLKVIKGRLEGSEVAGGAESLFDAGDLPPAEIRTAEPVGSNLVSMAAASASAERHSASATTNGSGHPSGGGPATTRPHAQLAAVGESPGSSDRPGASEGATVPPRPRTLPPSGPGPRPPAGERLLAGPSSPHSTEVGRAPREQVLQSHAAGASGLESPPVSGPGAVGPAPAAVSAHDDRDRPRAQRHTPAGGAGTPPGATAAEPAPSTSSAGGPAPAEREPATAAPADTAGAVADAAALSQLAGASLTAAELSHASGLSVEAVEQLESFGLIEGRTIAGVHCYDEDALAVAGLAASFAKFGIEARHLRIFKHAAERQAGLYSQVVLPLLRQRNPASRARALGELQKLSELGSSLQACFIRAALRDLSGG